jgi:signal transduction histidine kinase
MVVASSNIDRDKLLLEPPAELTMLNNVYKLTNDINSITDENLHTLWVPVFEKGKSLGYVRLTIRARDVAKIFDRIYLVLLIAAFIGFIAFFSLAMMMHFDLWRITSGLTSLFNLASEGETDTQNYYDEFNPVREAATRLGREVKNSRDKVDLVRRELTTVVNHVKVGVIILDENNRLDFINDRAKKLISPDDKIENYHEGFLHVMKDLMPVIKQLQHNEKLTENLLLRIKESHKTKHINAEMYRVDNQEWQGLILLIHDQDFIDAINQDLQSAARLKSLSTLLLGAIHDIKAPINAIMLNLELLDEIQNDTINDDSLNAHNERNLMDQKQYLTVIKLEMDRLNRLISGLYQQTLGEDTREMDCDLAQIIDELCVLLRPQAASQKVELQFNSLNRPVMFNGYPGQIKQALLNIMLNGLEAMPNGGVLKMELSAFHENARLVICDTGPGLPSSLKNKIFEMHFTTKTTGTGIGLYVSRNIIEKHSGSIHVDSDYGNGVCFTVTLPIV